MKRIVMAFLLVGATWGACWGQTCKLGFILDKTTGICVTDNMLNCNSSDRVSKCTKAELKEERKRLKEEQKQAEQKERDRLDHYSASITDVDYGCIHIDHITFHRDVERGWGGLLYGGTHAMLGVSAIVNATFHNNCGRVVQFTPNIVFFDPSGIQVGLGQQQQLLIQYNGQISVTIPNTWDVESNIRSYTATISIY